MLSRSTCARSLLWLVLISLTTAAGDAEAAIELQPVADGLSSPLYLTSAGDGSGRLFIVEQAGRIRGRSELTLDLVDITVGGKQHEIRTSEVSQAGSSRGAQSAKRIGGIAAAGLQFVHGFEIYLERATLLYEAGTFGGEWVVDRPLSLINSRGEIIHPKLKGGTEWYAAFTAELQTAVDGIRSCKEPEILSGRLARDALKLCFAEAKSISAGKAVSV